LVSIATATLTCHDTFPPAPHAGYSFIFPAIMHSLLLAVSWSVRKQCERKWHDPQPSAPHDFDYSRIKPLFHKAILDKPPSIPLLALLATYSCRI